MKRLRLLIGMVFWLTAIVGVTWWIGDRIAPDAPRVSPDVQGPHSGSVVSDLWQFAWARQPHVAIVLDEPTEVAIGDPIFVKRPWGGVEQIGEIRAIELAGDLSAQRAVVTRATALFYPTAPPRTDETELTHYAAPQSMEWVLATLLPPEKQQQIAEEMVLAFRTHRAEVLLAMRPVVEAGLVEALGVVEKDLPRAIAGQREALQRLGNRYQTQIVEKEIIPLVRREIWPIVRQRAEPLATAMGVEMWQRASAWRFGWRYLYDKSPLPEKDLIQKEWDRFVAKEALKVLRGHSDDLIAVQKEILTATAKNPAVRSAVHRHLSQIVDDEEFREIVWAILEEVLLKNPQLHQAIERHWKSDATRAAMRAVADRLEPHVRKMGEILIGSREEGITPEFAKILRNQILGKDRRWFLLESTGGHAPEASPTTGVMRVRCGGDPLASPFPSPPGRSAR